MSKLIISTIFAVAVAVVLCNAQAKYGPIVSAYLTGLKEQMSELEYQLGHNEIKRIDYDRAKQRLILQRRFVEQYARQSGEDYIPEFQILADEELGALGMNIKPNPAEINIGDKFESRWELVGIERSRTRFFIFIRKGEKGITNKFPDAGRSGAQIDPEKIIETIIVTERPPVSPVPSEPIVPKVTEQSRDRADQEAPRPVVETPRLTLPRLLHVYLPQYTEKARGGGVEGELILKVLFQSDGRVKNVKVEKGLGFGLDQRAIDSVKRLGFLPAQLDGKDVDALAYVVFNFKVNKVTVFVKSAEISVAAQGSRP